MQYTTETPGKDRISFGGITRAYTRDSPKAQWLRIQGASPEVYGGRIARFEDSERAVDVEADFPRILTETHSDEFLLYRTSKKTVHEWLWLTEAYQRASGVETTRQRERAFELPATAGENAEERFRRLSEAWRREARFISTNDRFMLPSYLSIIGMGWPAVPLMINDLRRGRQAFEGPPHWFVALSIITGTNPIDDDAVGNVDSMAEAWVKWGIDNGIIEYDA